MTEQEFIKKLPTIDNYYVIFCDFTKMPYAECDEQTFDDKAFIFLKESMAKKFVSDAARCFTFSMDYVIIRLNS